MDYPLSQEPKVTRMDLHEQEYGMLVQKWYSHWQAGNAPHEQYEQRDWSLEQAKQWLESRGWVILEWTLGNRHLRAFLGKPRPVRTKGQIRKMRTEITNNEPYYRKHGLNTRTIDLALYM